MWGSQRAPPHYLSDVIAFVARRGSQPARRQELAMRYTFVVPLLTALLVAFGFASARPLAPPAGDYCYLHGDHDHRLTWVSLDDRDPRTNETTIGPSRATKVDAIALQTSTGTLFGADSLIAENRTYLG